MNSLSYFDYQIDVKDVKLDAADINELGRPVTLYCLTPLGEEVVKKFIDVEKILKRGYESSFTA